MDFERKLLLRALLSSMPKDTYTLPDGCASIDDLDLAPLKVQALLAALGQRRKIDLDSNEFRWDVKQPPPKLSWGGSAEEGALGASLSAPLSGLSKRQLRAASFEALLLALGDDADHEGAVVKCVSAQLGIGWRQHKRLHEALHKREPAAPAPAPAVPAAAAPLDGDGEQVTTGSEAVGGAQGGGDDDGADAVVDGLSAAERAARECSLRHRLELLQRLTPSDFATDIEFYEWQERQAALLGVSLHTLVAMLGEHFDDPEQVRACCLATWVSSECRPSAVRVPSECRPSAVPVPSQCGLETTPIDVAARRLPRQHLWPHS